MTESRTPLLLCGEGTSDFGTLRSQHVGPLGEIVLHRLAERTGDETWRQRTRTLTHREIPASHSPRTDRKHRQGLRMELGSSRELYHLWDACVGFVLLCRSEDALGIFHSDVDFTNSQKGERRRRQVLDCLIRAIRNVDGDRFCIPIIPMPRMEAWLLYLAPECSMSAEQIEALPGNDHAPQAPKSILQGWGYGTGNHAEKKSFIQLIDDYYDAEHMRGLASFREFDQALQNLLDSAR